MDFKSRQDEMDVIKWYDSIIVGEDRCGTYIYCEKCNKAEEYPCAKAEAKYLKKYVRIAIVNRRPKGCTQSPEIKGGFYENV